MRSAGFCVFLFWMLVSMSSAHAASLPACADGREVVTVPNSPFGLGYNKFASVPAQQTYRAVIYLKTPMSGLGVELQMRSTGGPSPNVGDMVFKFSAQPTDALEPTCAGITTQAFQNLPAPDTSIILTPAPVQMYFFDFKNTRPVGTEFSFAAIIRLFTTPSSNPATSLLDPSFLYSSLARLIGDPHVTTWDGVTQTVFAEGDFLLVESPATGLALHSRHCKAAVGHWASWTCEVALRCDDSSEAMEISAAQWGNANSAAAGMTVEELPGDVRKVTCSSGLTMLAKRQRFHRHVYLNVQLSVNFPAALDARGLLGTPNGDASDDVCSRTGEVLKADLQRGRHGQKHYIGHALEELDAIHESWRVKNSEKLFKHDMLTTPSSSVRATGARGMAVPGITTEAAKTRCRDAGLETEADVAICVHDMVMFRHVDGAKNLAQFNEVVAMHM